MSGPTNPIDWSKSGAHAQAAPLRHVTSDAIEEQLSRMWREGTEAALAAGSPVLARNSLLTLVVYAPGDERGRSVLREVRRITAQMPVRAIALVPGPAAPGSAPLDVSLSITQRDASGNPAHGEEILLLAYDDVVRHLPGAVLPLILSGLPSFLWWAGEPPWRTELLEALVDGCDRLIVDASEAAQAERALTGLADLMRRKKSSCAISDLNWARQAPWRELVAQFFDDPGIAPYLFGIDRVTVEYAAGAEGGPLNPAQAYLFVGWLASRLGWQAHGTFHGHGIDSARQHLLTSGQGRNITLELNARYGVAILPWLEIQAPADAPQAEPPRAVGPGALMSIHMHSTVGGKTATFAVAREADLYHASTLCRAECAPPSQTVDLTMRGETQTLIEQLQILGHDGVYEDALALAARLIGPDGRRDGR